MMGSIRNPRLVLAVAPPSLADQMMGSIRNKENVSVFSNDEFSGSDDGVNPQPARRRLGIAAQFSGSDDGVNPQPGPLSWMKRAIRGERSVLIVNRRAAWNALGGVVDLQAETIEDGDRLERLITPPRQVRSNIVLGVIQ